VLFRSKDDSGINFLEKAGVEVVLIEDFKAE